MGSLKVSAKLKMKETMIIVEYYCYSLFLTLK